MIALRQASCIPRVVDDVMSYHVTMCWDVRGQAIICWANAKVTDFRPSEEDKVIDYAVERMRAHLVECYGE